MKMIKNIIVLFLTLGLLLTASGCSNSGGNSNSSGSPGSSASDDDDDYIYKNDIISIYNVNNEEIGSIECYYHYALVNGSILYTRLPEGASSDDRLEYWLYDIEYKVDHKLGVVDSRYEATYEVIKANDHLYLSISSGKDSKRENNKLTIYDVDLSEYSMTPLLEIEKANSYDSYTIANNKLIVAELLANATTDLVEYDLNEKHDSIVVHAYDESDCFVPNSIRHIYADSKYIYMVRLGRDESDNYFLCLDKYDFDYNLLNTVDLRDFCVDSDFENSEGDKINEWKQFISFFFVHNDLIYYENFSATHAIGTIESDKINRLFNINSYFSYVCSVSQNEDSDLFIREYDNDANGRNKFYRVDSLTHETETAEFYADNRKYYFWSALREGDKILLEMNYQRKNRTEEDLPERLYYIDVNDLEFKPME